jgi:uncharacterized protein
MSKGFTYPTEYFLQEGKENLDQCLHATFEAAVAHSVKKVIIFTSAGKGVKHALKDYCSKERYSHIKLIAVTFPSYTRFTAGDSSEWSFAESTSALLAENDIPVVRAHLPFEPITTDYKGHGLLGQDFSIVGNALRIFSGSMSLCVQAVLMASDAGHVDFGEHVIAMASDTSILVRAATTSSFLTDLIVREIICKPVVLTIVKSERVEPALEKSETDVIGELPPPQKPN